METINLTVYSYIVLGLIGVVVLLACWVVYLLQIAQEHSSVHDSALAPEQFEHVLARIEELERKLEEVQMMDPESKMYNRAVKMVKAGSSIEEVMEECELPRSEAQLLFSIHRN